MIMKNTRILSILLALVLISSVSCASDANPTDSDSVDSTPDSTTENPDETISLEDARQLVDDGLPERDYEGQEFTITVNDYDETLFFSEEQTGDVLSDIIYDRNRAVEERFNVNFNFVVDTYGNLNNIVRTSVLAGDDEYQLLTQHMLQADSWVLSEILLNWYDIPYVDFEKPWWGESNINDLTYHGAAFLALGDFSLSTIGRTYSIYFDKVQAEAYQLPDLYELVYDGGWTIDKLSEFSKDVYTDLNNNGTRDFEDFYGYTTSVASNIGAYLWAFGEKIIEDGELVLDVGKTTDIIAKLIDVTQVNPGTFYDPNYKNAEGNLHYVGIEKLAAGTTMFASSLISSGITYMRDVQNDYGIIPYPKWDEAQEDYITIVDGGCPVLAIPKSVADTEMSGIIAEALCAETYKNVIPDYYGLVLKEKGVRDEESFEMIDFIISKRVYDFGYIYDNWKGFGFTLEALVKEGNANFASYYAANESAKMAEYEKMFAVFENYGK